MYWPSVADLRAFYGSSLGGVVRQHLRRSLREIWPEVHEHGGQFTIVGVGYTAPYLSEMLASTNLPVAVMPAGMGALHWPAGGTERGNLSLLATETRLPLADDSVNRILLVHALETTESALCLLQEAWRVLKPQQRIIVIVPNRRSIWARREITPFGYGHPFSSRQLRALITEAGFCPLRLETTLMLPPTRLRLGLKLAATLPRQEKERGFFARCIASLGLGGVLILEAEKQRYATLKGQEAHAYRYHAVVSPATPTPATREHF